MTDTITIPVSAVMVKQPDGSYKISNAEYAEITPETIAYLFASAFNMRDGKLCYAQNLLQA